LGGENECPRVEGGELGKFKPDLNGKIQPTKRRVKKRGHRGGKVGNTKGK